MRMSSDDLPFLIIESAGFVEDPVRSRQLADVVEQASAAESDTFRVGQSHFVRDGDGNRRDTIRMSVGEARLCVDDERERMRDAIEAYTIRRNRTFDRFGGGNRVLKVDRLKIQPQAIARVERAEDAHELGIQPPPRR